MPLIRLQQHRSKVERIRSLEYQNARPSMAIIYRCNHLIATIDRQITALSNTPLHPVFAQRIALTVFEREEMINMIDCRRDTIQDDADSATAFETVENLDMLEGKLMNNIGEFTNGEINWLKEEAQELFSKCASAVDNGDDSAKKDFGKCKRFTEKLYKS